MIIDCISDLHGFYPELEGGDLLIVAGDLTARHTVKELDYFNEWIMQQRYKKKILIAGNHDTFFEQGVFNIDDPQNGTVFVDPSVDYLCDSGTEFECLDIASDGLTIVRKKVKIWGSPWTKTFEGMNKKCKAFTFDTEEELDQKWALIPNDIDILVTHSPPWGTLDSLKGFLGSGENVGSTSLLDQLARIRPKLHVYGHIHEGYGQTRPILEFCGLEGYPIFVNASHVNEHYKPVNKPIRVKL